MTTLTNGTIIGKAKVIVDIIKKGNHEIRPGTIIKPKFITIHNTGNTGRGANAKAHNTYIHNLASYDPKDTTHISWHFTVDEDYIYQHIPLNENAWHCGDGGGAKSGNLTSIGIEICHHVDQKNYAQAEANAVALTKYLCTLLAIPVASGVVPHKHWSGKNCPQVILARDKSLAKFIAAVSAYSNNVSAAAPAAPSDKYSVVKAVPGYTSAADAKAGKNKKTTVAVGEYHIYKSSNGMMNVTKTKGSPGSWINPADNKQVSAAPVPAPKPAPKQTYWYLRSGTYATKAAAEKAAARVGALGIASAEWMKVIATADKSKYYWETGTYTTQKAAEAAKKKVIDNKVAWVVDIKTK